METLNVLKELQKVLKVSSTLIDKSIEAKSDTNTTLHYVEHLAKSLQQIVEEYRGGTA